MRIVKISKFVHEENTIEWLVTDLLPSTGWTLLVGSQGLGKSTLAAQLCAALQKGEKFLGRGTRQTTVMYVQADGSSEEWRMMLDRICPDSEGLTVVDVPAKSLNNPSYASCLKDWTEKYKPGFIVFDSLYNLTSSSINTEAVLVPINIMKTIAGDRPWMLIHHPPHGEARAAGHHSISANCSNEWFLLKTKLKINKGRLVKDKEIFIQRNAHGLWEMKSGVEDILDRYPDMLGV